MKFKLYVLLFILFLSGCSVQESKEAKDFLISNLKDPESVQFRNEVFNEYGVCGEVNAKNSFGGYVGFKRFYSIKDPKTGSRTALIENDNLLVSPNLDAKVNGVSFESSWTLYCQKQSRFSFLGWGKGDVDKKFVNTDLTGLDYAKDFKLTDHNGKPRTLADFKGKLVLIFFGYTQCPDVCPTTMVEMANVMQKLGPDAEKTQVLFATIDPERDTQALLAAYVPNFDARFLGLYGDAAATAQVAKDFKVYYQKVPGKTPDSYTMDHTAGTYVFDQQGRIRLFLRHGQGPDPIVHDLKLLLAKAS
ncbi:SCO family protein [Undibacterium sp. CY7W]|uniref:SCO family protein n=2 Tax=Undibacterium TaxID=401469 RepID=A0A923I5S5_9BURK|nr:SCO family protein [Undibacterium rugosum]MBR7779102.1 SCO family protein [Undibacterium rugosum]